MARLCFHSHYIIYDSLRGSDFAVAPFFQKKKKQQKTEKRSLAEGQKRNTELIRSVTNARARKKLVVALTAAALIC